MAHGTPDWWGASPKSTTYSGMDTSELAARIGPIVSIDRRGDVIFQDNFDHGTAKIYPWGTGANWDVYPYCDSPLSGGLHLMLETGEEEGATAGITKELQYPVLGSIGLECAFVPDGDVRYCRLSITEWLPPNNRKWMISYNHTNGKLEILRSNGTYGVLATPGIVYGGYNDYTTIKLVINILLVRYERVIFNEHTYIATAHSGYVSAGGTYKCMTCDAYIDANVAQGATASLDNFLITQNEP